MIVAILAVMLVGIASFTVDFGQAYVSKRQLQTATDAGVLAAGDYYADKEGTCDELQGNLTYKGDAQDIANNIVDQNLHLDPVSTPDRPLSVTCNTFGQLVLGMTASRDTPVTLGAVYGVKSITTARTSEATVAPAASAHVKPYAICSKTAPSKDPGEVVQVGDPGNGHTGSDCPNSEIGGNWWWMDCPEDTAHSGTPDIIAENLKNGCKDPITVVPDQPTSDLSTVPPTPPDAGELSAALTEHCSSDEDRSDFCLTGDTGNSSLKNSKVYTLWDTLLGKRIFLPVFCDSEDCNPPTVNGTGTKSVYPVYKITAVILCGYHIYDKASGYYAPDPTDPSDTKCASDDFNATTAAGNGGDDKKRVWLYLKYTQLTDSEAKQFTEAGLGTKEDGGARQITLTK